MKKQTKNRLFKLLGIGACSFVLGLSACSSNSYYGDHSEETKQYEYIEKHTRKNAIVENDTAFVFDTTLCDSIADYLRDYGSIGTNQSTTVFAKVGPLTFSGGGHNYVDQTFDITFMYRSTNAGANSISFSYSGSSFDYNYVTHVFSHYGTTFEPLENSVFYAYDEGLYDYLLELYPPSVPDDNMGQVLTDFMSLLIGGIQSLAVGIAQGVASMASALFLNVEEGAITGLSTFGGIIAIFAGIALAVGITTRVYLWITRLGKD